jgi:hypothetical protein
MTLALVLQPGIRSLKVSVATAGSTRIYDLTVYKSYMASEVPSSIVASKRGITSTLLTLQTILDEGRGR